MCSIISFLVSVGSPWAKDKNQDTAKITIAFLWVARVFFCALLSLAYWINFFDLLLLFASKHLIPVVSSFRFSEAHLPEIFSEVILFGFATFPESLFHKRQSPAGHLLQRHHFRRPHLALLRGPTAHLPDLRMLLPGSDLPEPIQEEQDRSGPLQR